ncbi:MAG: hypothetical protein FGM33_06250 [Candidatus Kapabacteria bacterium]|nr:hypothetical protein [Candidatus Kapabacteria bacterium]
MVVRSVDFDMRICFLWHQHQPEYRLDGRFVLPWVRLHAVKDYLDLPGVLAEYPVRHTINLVPSMLEQLDAYSAGIRDPLEELALINTAALTERQHLELARWMLTLRDPMIEQLPRLASIMTRLRTHERPLLSEQEWRDAMVLFHLAWCGPLQRRTNPLIQRLIDQQEAYSEVQKLELMEELRRIVAMTAHRMVELQQSGHFEISLTPYHHPILPLVINSDVARESMPGAELPDPPYKAPFHAERHVQRAIDDWKRRSGTAPKGMWPAEGSLSMEALEILARKGMRWTATDEQVLRASADGLFVRSDVFFPYEVMTSSGPITILFRDHGLSDAIGFEYASWDASSAAADFMRRLEERRQLIIHEQGAEALQSAVIPVMLDGENCWEFYRHNGEEFLRALMQRLADDDRFTTVTCSQVAESGHARRLERLRAGSWINGDFGVWIGSATKNLAWSLLGRARQALLNSGASQESVAQQLEVLEASDWFWWYDDRHQAPHREEFDATFRAHLRAVFERCGRSVPPELNRPLTEHEGGTLERQAVAFGTTSMHRSDAIVRDVAMETSDSWQRLRVRLERRPMGQEELVIQALGDDGIERACLVAEDEVLWRSPLHDENTEWIGDNEIALYVHSGARWVIHFIEDVDGNKRRTTSVELRGDGTTHYSGAT